MSDDNDVNSNPYFIGRRDLPPIHHPTLPCRSRVDFNKPMWGWIAVDARSESFQLALNWNENDEEGAVNAGMREFIAQGGDPTTIIAVQVMPLKLIKEEGSDGNATQSESS